MWILALALLWPFATAEAEALSGLQLPIDCRLGIDCWPVRYVDHDAGPGAQDYRCNGHTDDGHRGVDIAIRDQAAMLAGVEVRAAADGVVAALRDGMADESASDPQAVAGRECGNGIRLDHGDGWTTWYCHLRRGSVAVAQGDGVVAGQPLALVGLSGMTTFPHLHFDVRHDGHAVDPFVGTAGRSGCGPGAQPMWDADVMAALAYRPVTLAHGGIAPVPPEVADARLGYHNRAVLPATSRVLELWVEAYWVEAGDRVHFSIVGPGDEKVLQHTVALDRDSMRWFQFVGARRPGAAWPAGTYRGRITLERPDTEPSVLERVVELRLR